MTNQIIMPSGRAVSQFFNLADIITEYFNIEEMKKARVKTVRSYFRKMRRKAVSSSFVDQPSNYTAEVNVEIIAPVTYGSLRAAVRSTSDSKRRR